MKSIPTLLFFLLALSSATFAAPPPGAPEIDPGSMVGPISMAIGTLLLISDRRKK